MAVSSSFSSPRRRDAATALGGRRRAALTRPLRDGGAAIIISPGGGELCHHVGFHSEASQRLAEGAHVLARAEHLLGPVDGRPRRDGIGLGPLRIPLDGRALYKDIPRLLLQVVGLLYTDFPRLLLQCRTCQSLSNMRGPPRKIMNSPPQRARAAVGVDCPRIWPPGPSLARLQRVQLRQLASLREVVSKRNLTSLSSPPALKVALLLLLPPIRNINAATTKTRKGSQLRASRPAKREARRTSRSRAPPPGSIEERRRSRRRGRSLQAHVRLLVPGLFELRRDS